MSESKSNSDPGRLPVRYEQQRGVVRFCGPVEANRIFALCDEIDSLINEYYYNQVVLEIDSPGGDVKSLLYYCEKLKGWRQHGVRIETVALTLCASAAAFMLSLGDIGQRRAMPRASLLYHNARIVASSQIPLTSDRLEKLRTSLSQTDSDMLVVLLRHLYSDVSESCFVLLEELTCRLPYMERKVDAAAFKILKNAKVNKLAAALEKTTDGNSAGRLRVELLHLVNTGLHSKQLTIASSNNLSELQQTLNLSPAAVQNELASAWLLRRFEHYRDLFTQDAAMCSEEAQREGLIDHIRG